MTKNLCVWSSLWHIEKGVGGQCTCTIVHMSSICAIMANGVCTHKFKCLPTSDVSRHESRIIVCLLICRQGTGLMKKPFKLPTLLLSTTVASCWRDPKISINIWYTNSLVQLTNFPQDHQISCVFGLNCYLFTYCVSVLRIAEVDRY